MRASVITTKLGYSEFVENGKDGLIVEPRDSDRLEHAIVKLMDDPLLREKLGMNARNKALRYSWEEVAARYYNLYRNTVAM
jgi:glycogen synthase